MNQFPTAADTDPVKMGWMVGSPPPPDKLISFDDGGVYQFPKTRWSFCNFRRMGPTTAVSRGLGPASPLLRTELAELDNVEFSPLG